MGVCAGVASTHPLLPGCCFALDNAGRQAAIASSTLQIYQSKSFGSAITKLLVRASERLEGSA